MKTDLFARLAELQVPRYTSYPTAADFSDAVGCTEQHLWLGRLDPTEAVSVYLHVPYCRQLCHYCGCHAKAVLKAEPVQDYCRALEAEIALVAARLPARMKIGRIAWGGGTPCEAGLGSVLGILKKHFDLEDGYEHSIELDPRLLGHDLCQALRRVGINRASLGVLDLDPLVQQAIGRVQPEPQVAAAVRDLRAAGISRIDFDLIYGLPNQTVESLLSTCQSVAALDPDRIAFYGYAHLPSRRANQRLIDTASLPAPVERLEQVRVIASFFRGKGYEAIGIDHFAKPADSLAVAAREGRLHRNFQGYTDDDRPNLLGFGCSSISRLPGGYFQSEPGTEAYKRRIVERRLPTRRGHAFVEDDRARAAIIERLMCDFSVNLGQDAVKYADELALLRPFALGGIVTMQSNNIAMTQEGRPFVRLVSAAFDRFRSEGSSRFSAAT
jgi:oxygen-independent coproporphyrinogen III oxidase